ncbi:MAG: hypothetical protein KBS52_02130, partial [Clostridiales bacterium]|nr:hypothetical protein [Candidatus Equinaster intestinalis]
EFILPDIPEMSKDEILRLEKEATGLYLSGHPLDGYAPYIKKINSQKIGDISAGKYKDGSRVTVLALLNSIKVKTLKSGQIICYACAEDISGSIDLTLFGKTYSSYRHLLTENAVVMISGRVSEREDRPTEIVCDSLTAPDQNSVKLAAKQKSISKVYIKVPSINCKELDKIRKILAGQNGSIAVIIYCEDTKKQFSVPESMKIRPESTVISEISEIIGDNNIKTVE